MQPGATVSDNSKVAIQKLKQGKVKIVGAAKVSKLYLSCEPVLMLVRQTLKRWLRKMAQADLQGKACISAWQHSLASEKA